MLYLAVCSGLRRGELFGLQWGDLDKRTNTLRIICSNYQCEITSPKTDRSVRTVGYAIAKGRPVIGCALIFAVAAMMRNER